MAKPKSKTVKTSSASTDSVTIAIVSDLHAHDQAESGSVPSHLRYDAPEDQPGQHPITGLLELISQDKLKADLMLCGGDLGDKAKPGPMQYAWGAVHRIKKALSAKYFAATAGNHDVDSRHVYNDHDAKGHLQSLRPRFPVDNQGQFDRYWSRHFVMKVTKLFRLLLINSSAYHGGSPKDDHPPEYRHGRVSDQTLTAISEALTVTECRDINIVLCHHHPIPHEELNLGPEDLMLGGAELINLLSSGSFGEWFVAHGHKHHPKLTYAPSTSSNRPIVFAAGSLCACLFPELQTQARNQFYLFEFPLSQCRQLGIVGRFRAWDWATGKGWIPARDGSGLPHRGGFGYQQLPRITAGNIIKSFSGQVSTTWNSVIDRFPEIEFYSPDDLHLLIQRLEMEHGARVLENMGEIHQIDMTP